MDTSSNNGIARVIAPRPLFMSGLEQDEYAKIHRFIRERRENNVVETRVHCRFYNMTKKDIDVIWCREEDDEDYIYGTLAPKRYLQITTFQGHPWMFRSAEDGERMEILRSESRVHFPQNAPSKMVQTSEGEIALQVVFIRSPSAKNTTLKQLSTRLISRYFSTDQLFTVNFPTNLLSDLLEYQINKLVYVNSLSPTENLPEKAPAVKTLDYLKKILADIENKSCTIDLREKVKSNLKKFSMLASCSSAEEDPLVMTPSSSNAMPTRKRSSDENMLVDAEDAEPSNNEAMDHPPTKRRI